MIAGFPVDAAASQVGAADRAPGGRLRRSVSGVV